MDVISGVGGEDVLFLVRILLDQMDHSKAVTKAKIFVIWRWRVREVEVGTSHPTFAPSVVYERRASQFGTIYISLATLTAAKCYQFSGLLRFLFKCFRWS